MTACRPQGFQGVAVRLQSGVRQGFPTGVDDLLRHRLSAVETKRHALIPCS